MNNYCWYCGKKLNDKSKKCNNCNAEVVGKRVNVEERTILVNKLKKDENTLFFVTLLLPFTIFVLESLDLMVLSPLILIAALVCFVYLRKKFFYSTKVKIFTSLVLLGIVASIIFIIWICVECGIIHPGL